MIESPELGPMDKCELDVFLQDWRQWCRFYPHFSPPHRSDILEELQNGFWWDWDTSGPQGIRDVLDYRRCG